MTKAEQILQQVEERIEKPMVTALFGDNWKEHQKRMLEEGQITAEMLIDIAWKQGRRALLLEQAVNQIA